MSEARELRFASKSDARQWSWDALQDQGAARFPFPPHGRIPNFAGAEAAARRLFEEPPWRDARTLKINPDSPQRPVRELALAGGAVVCVPTPRLKGGFHRLDPARIPRGELARAAALATMTEYSEIVALEDMPALDAIVTGCAAVTVDGRRAGKGEGYSDLEFAILRELGFDALPVATTVHDLQVVAGFPIEANDIPLSLICTPTRTLRVAEPPPAPAGIDWSRLSEDDLDAMPILRDLQAVQARRREASR